MRWQAIQLLLEPEYHGSILQRAVERLDLTNPVDGRSLPSMLPKESLPCRPDMEMVEWYKIVSEKLTRERQEKSLSTAIQEVLSHREGFSSVSVLDIRAFVQRARASM